MCAYFRRAGGMYFVHLEVAALCAIRARGVDVLELGLRWANRRMRRGVAGVRRRDGGWKNACSAKREAGRSKIVRGGSEGLKYNRTLLPPIISLKLALKACISQSRFLAHSFAVIDPRLALLHSSGKNLTRLEWPVRATHSKTPPFSSPTRRQHLSSHNDPKCL